MAFSELSPSGSFGDSSIKEEQPDTLKNKHLCSHFGGNGLPCPQVSKLEGEISRDFLKATMVDFYVPVCAICFAEHDLAGVVQDEHGIQM